MVDVCPFNYRYGSENMREVFSRDSMLRRYVQVEAAAMRGLEAAGLAPKGCWEEVLRCGSELRPEDVDEVEARLGHEMASLATLLGERCGECGKYVHLGLTSNDVIDTAWALAFRDALRIILKRLEGVIEFLASLAVKHSRTVMVGRTHGVHAIPLTFGFKLANYVYELSRSYERLCEACGRVVKCNISGAVGTMAAWGGKGLTVRDVAAEALRLEPHPITTQIAPRDGFAELLADLAILASQLDRLALEVRELSRDEVGEAFIASGEVGSSTMPHKRNPTLAERVSGLAKVARSFIIAGLENIPLMHERDLTNSSSERVVIPHAFLTVDQALIDAEAILKHLVVDEEAMRRNLSITKGAVMSECVMVKLVLKAGMPRHEAHAALRKLRDECIARGEDFLEAVRKAYGDLLGEELGECLNPENYLGSAESLIHAALKHWEGVKGRCEGCWR
ncbi:MAG: adenylosuccinate lyase [Desulfurococcales archaeon]|nr:adenylosuccinate lyase [Desulfurococcales archaeon]